MTPKEKKDFNLIIIRLLQFIAFICGVVVLIALLKR